MGDDEVWRLGELTAEGALRHGAAILASVVEGTTDAVFVKDTRGRYVLCNAATCRFLGRSRDQIIGRDDMAVLDPTEARLVMARDREIMESGEARTFEETVTLGAVRHTFLSTRGPVRGDDGRIIGLFDVSRDITERKKMEQALRDGDEKFWFLFNRANVGTSILSPTGQVHVNPAMCAMLGYAPDEMQGRHWSEFTHPDDIALTQREIDRLVAGETESVHFVKRYVGKRDNVIWMDVSSAVCRDASGALKYTMSTLIDITERRRAEAALLESEYFFRETQRSANVGSYRLDIPANTYRSSEVLDRLFGIDAEYPHTTAVWVDLIHPDDRAAMVQYLQEEVLGRRRGFDKEYRIVRRNDGVVRWLHGLGALECDADGNPVTMSGTIQDVTERKAAADALRRNDEQHRLILQAATDGFWLLDMRGRLLETNESYARMSGYTVQELLGMRIPDLEARESDAEAAAHIRTVIATGQDLFEAQHRRKDGSVYDVEVSAQYQSARGDRLVAFIRDISARKQAEAERRSMQAQLQQAQRIESVGRLAGGVAHDFNNMLGVILGNVELAIAQLDATHPLREDLNQIRDAALRSVELTRQLLAFARKQTVAPKVLDLNATVAGMMKMLQRLIGEDIALTWHPAPSLRPVKMDPSQIDQILANLCVNARDAITGVGTLTIETGHRTVSRAEHELRVDLAPGEYVTLSVRDDGTGMDQETLAHLFEPFFTTKALGKGTGLGLATVWGIVRQNEGFIDVTSAPGRGTTFRISLPCYAGDDARDDAEASRSGAPRGHETILVTEDEPGILALVGRMLEEQGYQVLRASTPTEAERLADEHGGAIHLLISDVVMPEMNGQALANRLTSRYPGLKRMFMSGYTADVIASHSALEPGIQVVQKPFTKDTLAQAVRDVLDHDRRA